ncbi:MAG: hypothetical protein LBH36_03245 [Candidatus Nomurabacteria bacterium]|jgi:hypothetical protein|nr:hypothetical protein [Candidatus Nomurabacteria bacterium]
MDRENNNTNSVSGINGNRPHGRVIQPLNPIAYPSADPEPAQPAATAAAPDPPSVQPAVEPVATQAAEAVAAPPVEETPTTISIGIPKSVWVTAVLMIVLPLLVAVFRNILYESSINGNQFAFSQTIGDTFVIIDIMVQSTLLSFAAPNIFDMHSFALEGFMHNQWFVWAVIGLCVVTSVYMITRLKFARIAGIIGCWVASAFNFFIAIRTIVLLMQTTPAETTLTTNGFVGYCLGYATVFAVIGLVLFARAARLSESSTKAALDQKVVKV